jgi:hypothetical protein
MTTAAMRQKGSPEMGATQLSSSGMSRRTTSFELYPRQARLAGTLSSRLQSTTTCLWSNYLGSPNDNLRIEVFEN